MSSWSNYILYSQEKITGEQLGNVLSILGISCIDVFESTMGLSRTSNELVYKKNMKSNDVVRVISDHGIESKYNIVVYNAETIRELNQLIVDSGQRIAFRYLALCIECGRSSLLGFGAREDVNQNDIQIDYRFAISIGGDDAETEYRRVWNIVHSSKKMRDIVSDLGQFVGYLEENMILTN